VTGVQTCALPIYSGRADPRPPRRLGTCADRLGAAPRLARQRADRRRGGAARRADHGGALARGHGEAGRRRAPRPPGSNLTPMPDQPAAAPDLHRAVLDDLSARTIYLLATLRQDVFTMEQGATDADLDGRELEPTTELLWLEEEGAPIAHLRLLRETDGTLRIGRVAVRADRRRGGHGRRLMVAALERARELAPSA